ncbi:MAG: hypothetical protein M1819_007491 [Sarea resinae]|nr:MAG: hypothetical protein M1819_007491 [Sarea resinae]
MPSSKVASLHEYSPPDHDRLPQSVLQHRAKSSDPNRLAPEDAFFAHSPPKRQRQLGDGLLAGADGGRNALLNASAGVGAARRKRDKSRGRSASRRRKGVWKKLLWVKQSYPDNYTDEETFLDHLQRNPRLQPYDFWPLVADSTVIVQHVCSVILFICCFAGISQNRVSPVSVVSWGSFGTVVGWILYDFWVGQEEAAHAHAEADNPEHVAAATTGANEGDSSTSSGSATSTCQQQKEQQPQGLGLTLPSSLPTMASLGTSMSSIPPTARLSHSRTTSANTLPSTSTNPPTASSSPIASGHPTGAANFANYSYFPPYGAPASPFSPRNQQRIATAKSAILIYSALLGLSPILKSLTKSTTSDSIWAMSCWLMCINVFFFDYGGGVGVKFPASLSTNAAVMASTVLASRLPSTTHVFSLTLFSIEVFGLFPVFRRHLRHISWRGHLLLTTLLVMGAGASVGVILAPAPAPAPAAATRDPSHAAAGFFFFFAGCWKSALGGLVTGGLLTALAMGGCSWWLIGLQKYKNEIHGPWDPARPVIRRQRWD